MFPANKVTFKTNLFDPRMGPKQVLPHRGKVDLEVMAMRGYSLGIIECFF